MRPDFVTIWYLNSKLLLANCVLIAQYTQLHISHTQDTLLGVKSSGHKNCLTRFSKMSCNITKGKFERINE